MTITQRDACEDIKGALQRYLCTGAHKSKEQTEHVVHGCLSQEEEGEEQEIVVPAIKSFT